MSDPIKTRKKAGERGGPIAEERRSGDRHSFTASAEVIEISSGARFSTRMTDLSHGGCFVDTMVPFPVGSKVHIKVHQGKNEFETDGMVVYSQHGLGMGVAFDAVDPERRKALDHWIQELTGDQKSGRHDVGRSLAPVGKAPRSNGTALVRLVQLMVGKGLLTEAEGMSVLEGASVNDLLF
jgi:PilZ domain